jgi:thymidylate synthase
MEVGMAHTDQRGDLTFEVLNANLVLHNPLNRVVTSRARMMNLGFAIAEFLSEVNGDDSVAMMTAFIPSYTRFSSDGCTIDGSYAGRLHGVGNQLESTINMLNSEPSTRRGVITIYDKGDLLFGRGGRNTPCTLSLQYIKREGRLYAITNMRSNDVHLGLTYDVFNFTMLQEYVALMTKSELGEYYHNAGSLHLYDRDVEVMRKISMEKDNTKAVMWSMSRYAALEMKRVADRVSRLADSAVNGEIGHFSSYVRGELSTYSRDLIAVCFAHAAKRTEPHHALAVSNLIQSALLKEVTQNWLIGKTH